MATVIKESTEFSKGVIVFTHKEKLFFESWFARHILKGALLELGKKYFFAMHWGHFNDNVGKVPYIDFHLAGQGTLQFTNPSEHHHIPLCSRNFINKEFTNKDYSKVYDIINVSRPIRLKHIDEFFLVIKKIFDKGINAKVLIICPLSPDFASNDYYYNDIYDEYLSIFSKQQRSFITLLMLSPYGNPFQLAESSIADFMNMSKIFTLFSDQEGESRVVSEALLCGLPVVVKKHLKGGGRDYLNAQNSKLFGSLDEAADIFADMILNYANYRFDTAELQQQLSETYTKITLQEELNKFFQEKGEAFEGLLHFDNLDRKLPSHEKILPLSIRSEVTNDIKNFIGFSRYVYLMNNKTIPHFLLLKIYLFQIVMFLKAKIKFIFVKIIKRIQCA